MYISKLPSGEECVYQGIDQFAGDTSEVHPYLSICLSQLPVNLPENVEQR
jgi:hypothetical protein